MKKILLTIIILFVANQLFSQLRTIEGIVILENQVSYDGISINLKRVAPSELIYNINTDLNGNYSINVEEGIYEIIFSKQEYINDTISDINVYSDIVIPNDTLEQIGLSGNISGILEAGTYKVGGDLLIDTEDSLIINPGVILLFLQDVKFIINGYVYAVGTNNDSIRFTHYNQDSRWSGIELNTANDNSILSYCRIDYCNKSSIRIIETSPTISNCEISDCIFINNGGTGEDGGGAGISLKYSNSILTNLYVHNNELISNAANGGYGGGIFIFNSSSVIRNSIINNNSIENENPVGGGIYISASSNVKIQNSIISNNIAEWAGGIRNQYGYLEISNSIVCDNISTYQGGIGVGGDSDNTNISYCNFWNNSPQNFYNCNSYIGTNVTTNNRNTDCDAFYNIQIDPMFVDASVGNFSFLQNSMCIDVGENDSIQINFDFLNNDRIKDGDDDFLLTIDLGAIEYISLSDNIKERNDVNFWIYPNPAKDYFIVNLDNNKKSDLKVYDITGKVVFQKEFSKEINISTNKFKEGIYFIKVKNNNDIMIRKIIVK